MEYSDSQQPIQIMCNEHKTRCYIVCLATDAPNRFLCPTCLSGRTFKDLMNIEDFLSHKLITQYESKCLESIKECNKNIKKSCEDVLEKVDTVFNKYMEQLQTLKDSYKKRIVSINQKSASEIINKEHFEVVENLRADSKKLILKPDLSESQLLTNYLWNFNRLRNFHTEGLLNIDMISKTVEDSLKELDHVLKSKFETLNTLSFLNSLTERNNNSVDALSILKRTPKTHYIHNAHSSWIRALKISKNGRWLVSGSLDNSIKIWELETHELYHTFQSAHNNIVNCVDISLDSQSIVSGSADKTVAVWSIFDKKLLAKDTHTDPVACCRYSPKGNLIASSAANGTIIIWKASDLKLIRCMTDAHDGVIQSISFHPNSEYFVSAGNDKVIKCWNLETGENLFCVKKHTEMIYAIQFSYDGTKIVAGGLDFRISVTDFKTREVILTIPTKQRIDGLCMPNDNRVAITYTHEPSNSVNIWSLVDGSILQKLSGVRNTAWVHSIDISDNCKYLATGHIETTIVIYEFSPESPSRFKIPFFNSK